MSKIKGKDTLLERKVRKELFSKGIRYRLGYPIEGKPDLTLPSKKIAIFINGCFWHQHKHCKLASMPKSNTDFWRDKLIKNIERDIKVKSSLETDNWEVLYVWECDIEKRFDDTISDLLRKIRQ